MMNDTQLKAAINIIASVLGCKKADLSGDTYIGSLSQWDSIAHMTIILAFEEKLGRQLSTKEIASLENISSFAELLAPKDE